MTNQVKTRLLFFGTPELGIPALERLVEDLRFEVIGVVTQPDKPAGRGLKPKQPPLKTAAVRLGLPVLQPASLKTPAVLEEIRKMEPDLIAVAAYGLWIPEEIFNLPPKRSLNLHPSLLPRHRGAAPVVSAILAGEKEAGMSVLFIEDEMDAGDVFSQITIPISDSDTAGSVMAKCALAGSRFFVDTLAGWIDGTITPKKQDHRKSTWIDRLKKEEGLIDWTSEAVELKRRCRAFNPWPGTFTFFGNRRLLIHKVSVIDKTGNGPSETEPGRVIRHGTDICVVTGKGLLSLESVQLEYRRVVMIGEFIHGQPGFIGTRLG